MTVSWTAQTNAAIYEVEYFPDLSSQAAQVNPVDSQGTQLTINNLLPGRFYCVSVTTDVNGLNINVGSKCAYTCKYFK